MPAFNLISKITVLSNADNWEVAKTEWILDVICISNEPETCLCNHYPIIELCTLKNKYNGNLATVGNCCVKKFIGLPSDKIFQAVKRIRKDIAKNLNGETIEHAYHQHWINDWEYNFYCAIFRKRKCTDKQKEKKKQINQKIIFNLNKK